MLPGIIVGMIGLKMFFFKRCIKAKVKETPEDRERTRQIEELQNELHNVTTDLERMEKLHNDSTMEYNHDQEVLETRRVEIANRQSYVDGVKNQLVAMMAADTLRVDEFEDMCSKYTGGQKDLENAISELHVNQVEYEVKYEHWSLLFAERLEYIKLLKEQIDNVHYKISLLEGTHSSTA
jgi:chromosome segregation ATPase